MTGEPADRDVPIALGSLLAGAGAGGALVALFLAAARSYQTGPPSPAAGAAGGTTPPGTTALGAAAVVALVLAAIVAFRRARRLGTRWQRVALSGLAGFGTVVVGLLAVPLDQGMGRSGLVALGAASFAIAVAGWTWARRAERSSPA